MNYNQYKKDNTVLIYQQLPGRPPEKGDRICVFWELSNPNPN